MLGRFGIVEVFFVVMLCILIPVGLRYGVKLINRDKRNAIEERLEKVEKAIADLKTEK